MGQTSGSPYKLFVKGASYIFRLNINGIFILDKLLPCCDPQKIKYLKDDHKRKVTYYLKRYFLQPTEEI